ncbi:hypothetical protein Pla163_36600 [Planctomycetes bacterium Pla163]|uniref:Uncharacterized protein n=2 Tax=Rohdeia mirabilis TaxID=2528008 RepID=A0A518D4W5_9BACT|nr:hypothetical protein Pla163_36600 [Planctomycetes bacterium Pla163]
MLAANDSKSAYPLLGQILSIEGERLDNLELAALPLAALMDLSKQVGRVTSEEERRILDSLPDPELFYVSLEDARSLYLANPSRYFVDMQIYESADEYRTQYLDFTLHVTELLMESRRLRVEIGATTAIEEMLKGASTRADDVPLTWTYQRFGQILVGCDEAGNEVRHCTVPWSGVPF